MSTAHKTRKQGLRPQFCGGHIHICPKNVHICIWDKLSQHAVTTEDFLIWFIQLGKYNPEKITACESCTVIEKSMLEKYNFIRENYLAGNTASH